MSEFSNSLHLIAADPQDGVDLLRNSGTRGWVFEPTGPWVTIVPEGSMPMPASDEIVEANVGLLFDYVNAEDHGFFFRLFRGPVEIAMYGSQWERGLLDVDDARLNLDQIIEVLSIALQRDLDIDRARRILTPESRQLTWSPDGNLGDEFARFLGLKHFSWLSGHYLASPDWPEDELPRFVD